MHSFTTERLLIRPLALQDKALYLSLYTDAKIMRNIGEPLTTAAAEKAFASTLKVMNKPEPKILSWAIVDNRTHKEIGLQALKVSNNKKCRTAEIGIMLSSQANGKLFPEEAMGALMEYAFTQLNIDCINAFYSKNNLATKRFVNKLGFCFNTDSHKSENNNHHQYFEQKKWQQSLITRILPLKTR